MVDCSQEEIAGWAPSTLSGLGGGEGGETGGSVEASALRRARGGHRRDFGDEEQVSGFAQRRGGPPAPGSRRCLLGATVEGFRGQRGSPHRWEEDNSGEAARQRQE
jgi:hypothetical protein